MPPETPDLRVLEVRSWLARATEDLRAGRHDLTAIPPIVTDAAFHAQQCAKKAMKAFLVHLESPFRKTHNLTELGGAVARLAPGLSATMREASLLTDYAWRFRYPCEAPTLSTADAVRALDLADRTLRAVIDLLPESCRI